MRPGGIPSKMSEFIITNSIIPKPVQKRLAKIVWDITILLPQVALIEGGGRGQGAGIPP